MTINNNKIPDNSLAYLHANHSIDEKKHDN